MPCVSVNQLLTASFFIINKLVKVAGPLCFRRVLQHVNKPLGHVKLDELTISGVIDGFQGNFHVAVCRLSFVGFGRREKCQAYSTMQTPGSLNGKDIDL